MRQTRIAAVCASASDARTLRLEVLAELRRTVPFTWYAWLLTDPETGVGAAPLADVPSLRELPSLIRLKYQTAVHRWTDLTTPVARLSDVGDRRRSLVWREWQSRFGVVDVASVVFRDQYGTWGFLDLWRDAALGDFRAADVDRLLALTAPVTAAIRRCLGDTFRAPADGLHRTSSPVVLLLGSDLAVRAQTPDADRALRLLLPPDGDHAPVPAGAYNVAAQLLASEAGVDHTRPGPGCTPPAVGGSPCRRRAWTLRWSLPTSVATSPSPSRRARRAIVRTCSAGCTASRRASPRY